MATTLTAKLDCQFSWKFIDTDAASGAQIVDSNSVSIVDSLANGTVINTVNRKWSDRRTVNDAANDDLDLAGGLTDPFGNAITFAKVCGLIVHNRNTTAGENLVVGGGSNPWITWLGATGDQVVVAPDGVLLLWNPSLAGYAVTASTGDILRLTGSGGNITYDIALIGRSA